MRSWLSEPFRKPWWTMGTVLYTHTNSPARYFELRHSVSKAVELHPCMRPTVRAWCFPYEFISTLLAAARGATEHELVAFETLVNSVKGVEDDGGEFWEAFDTDFVRE